MMPDEGRDFVEWMVWVLLFGLIIATGLWFGMVVH